MPTSNSRQIPWTNKLVTSTASSATKWQSSFYQSKKKVGLKLSSYLSIFCEVPIILTLTRQPWWQPFWPPRVPQGGCLVFFSGSLKLPAWGGLPGWYTFSIFFVWDLAILQLKEFWSYWLTGPNWHWWGSTSVRYFTSSRDQNHLLWAFRKEPAFFKYTLNLYK